MVALVERQHSRLGDDNDDDDDNNNKYEDDKGSLDVHGGKRW